MTSTTTQKAKKPVETPAVVEKSAPQPAANQKSSQSRARQYRRLVNLVSRVQVTASGRKFVRFNSVAVFEHWALLLSFLLLTVTGLLLQFSGLMNLTPIIQWIFRDIDQLTAIHNVGAVGFLALSVFHGLRVFYLWYARGEGFSLALTGADVKAFGGLLSYLFKKGGSRPAAGRYSIEEKLTYWWLALCGLFLVLTALVLWAPVLVSKYLPDFAMPAARTIHTLTGLLVVLTLLPWHLYHTLIKERNASIFTGVLSEADMLKNHPLEYQQIMAAFDELRQIQAKPAGAEAAPLSEGAKQPALSEQPGD